jgi:hypothetical protein
MIKSISPNLSPLENAVSLSESFMTSKRIAAANERTKG